MVRVRARARVRVGLGLGLPNRTPNPKPGPNQVENNNGWTVLHAGVNADKLECVRVSVSDRVRVRVNQVQR